MKNAPLRHAVEYAAFLPWKGVLRLLPHAASRAFGHRLGDLAWAIDRRRRRIADENLAAAFPALAEAKRRELVRGCFRAFGASACDALSAARFAPEELLARVERQGWESFAHAAENGRGTIVLGSHYGNWEVVSPSVALTVGTMAIVGRPADNPLFDREMQALRVRFGNRSLDKRGSVREMFRVLAAGGRLGLLVDQRVRRDEAIEVPFLGRPALTSPIVARLAARTGAAVVPVFGEHLPKGRYRLEALPPILADAGEDDVAFTRRCLEPLEARIRERPELWLWLHRRWKQ